TPNGRMLSLGDQTVETAERYSVSLDRRLARELDGLSPEIGLFAGPSTSSEQAPDSEGPQPLNGHYTLLVEGLLFEPESQLDVKMVVYGKVHGLAGTDHLRRDITVALYWGAAVALAFGLLAAVGSSLSTLIIAAIGVWYGRWTDASIQRVTELNMILPGLPILILVGTLYTRSIWVILGIVILLGIFSASIKVYRAIFLQVRESPYIEASRAYGASNLRIILLYMVPRVIPVLVPGFVTLIPTFVFLEASLAILGLGDPVLPTWGKVLNDAQQNGALYKGYYYWVLAPSVLLMLTGLGFAMVGFTLDRIFNPRLREL
ncbi:MAG TPA: ABC transporter permease, partial [Dehalococcoidia bacterium]|nr:ABC transporter permease [Dehalococcoidia bacterium]